MGQFNNDILNIIYRFGWISLSRNSNEDFRSEYKNDPVTMQLYRPGGCHINWRILRPCYRQFYPSIYNLGTFKKTGILPKNYY